MRGNLPLDYDYNIGKLPPQAIDLEEAIIGGLIMESKAILKVAGILASCMFYKEEHQKIYQAIEQLFNNSKPIDLLTVTDQIRKNKDLDDIGGVVYISKLTSNIGSASHIEYHALIIKQKWIAREIIRICTEVNSKSFDDSVDINETVDYLQSELYNVMTNTISIEPELISKIGIKRLKELQEMNKENSIVSGVPTGYNKIDRITSGWQKTDFIIIGARPSMGKTALALKFAMFPSLNGYKVLMFSLEMSKRQLFDRSLSVETGIENSFIRTGSLDDYAWNVIDQRFRRFEDMGLYIDDTPSITTTELRAKAMLHRMKHGLDLLIVDYLQLMRSVGKRDREQEISDISRTLKSIAKELDIPVIALSQLNRAVEQRSDKRPQLSDLRESGSMEQDADIVMFIHRPEYYGIMEINGVSTKQLIEILLQKHRNGALGEFNLWRSKNWSDITERQDMQNTIFDEEESPKRNSGVAMPDDIDDEMPF